MAIDLTLPVKEEIIKFISANAGVTALVPVERIFAMTPPALPEWPFIRYGSPITTGFDASCWDGSVNRVTLHAFAVGEDNALSIASAIVAAMIGFEGDVGTIGVTENQWLSTNCIRDEQESDRWHAIVEYSITAILPS